MDDSAVNNRRIAKNTMMLYLRMFLLLGISLYTSRVVLQVLGVEDYGVYNAVGGFVAMFGMLSSTLSGAISRFITVELGKGNKERLRMVFSTSLKVQLLMAVVVAILAEIIGIWFLYNKMQIPDGRYDAAQWVLHCSIISFIISLFSVPFKSTIIAHEKMSAFAYISILEAALKLGIVFLLSSFAVDKLALYAVLLLAVQTILFFIYAGYCWKKFEECRGKSQFDKSVFREMWGFAGWSFFGNTAYVFNTQGVNMVMNVFFGVVVNAARGIANQVNGAVNQFVNNFTMAINPQIVKSYAVGNKEDSFRLVCRGAKFSFFLMYVISLPIMLEVDQILKIWLKTPPEGSSAFVVWTILASMTTVLGCTLLPLINATGDIKKYQIMMAVFGFSPFPLTWIAYKFGAPAIWAYPIFFVVYYILIYVRLWLVHDKTGIPYAMYFKEVVFRTHITGALALILPLAVVKLIEPSIARLFITCGVSVVSCGVVMMTIGLTPGERDKVEKKAKDIFKKFSGHVRLH